MPNFSNINQRLKRLSTYLAHVVLLCLVILGVMNIVQILNFQAPSDGAVWQEHEGNLTIVELRWPPDETDFQVGDILRSINDAEINSDTDRQDYLYSFELESNRPFLYRIERSGSYLDHWIYIRGVKVGDNQEYILQATCGFVYLAFLLLLLLQNIRIATPRSLAFFSFCVFLQFVFSPTNRFARLDWITLFLDKVGELLLPSSIACVAIASALGKSRWRGFAQTIHWLPTCILTGWSLWVHLQSGGLIAYLLDNFQKIQLWWASALIVATVLLLGLVADLRSSEKNLTVFWGVAWLPLTLFQLYQLEHPLEQEFPYDEILAVLPVVLPMAFLFNWSRSGRLYLGTIAKKVIVYFSVVVVLLLSYALFIALFQTLMGGRISSGAHTTILGMGIMFAAVTYAPLNHFIAELLERLIYGKRYQSIREFSDLTGINRADTNIDDFLFIILKRIKKAFRVESGSAFKSGENAKIYKTILPIEEQLTFLFENLPPQLMNGALMRGHQLDAYEVGVQKKRAFLSNDYILPIRVSGQLTALVIFSMQSNHPNLSPEEERLLRGVLRQCEVLMENMELYHAVHQKAISFNRLKEYNENIIESSRIGIMSTDEMDRTVSCNRAMLELTGLAKLEVMGKSFANLFQIKQTINQRQTSSGFILEGTFENLSGSLVEMEVQRTPLRTRENEVYGTLFLVEDISEKKRIKENLMQQEKLASIGLLAAGVAHEINTPLTGIASYNQLLMGDPSINDDQRELLELIQAQSRRAAKIVNELLNFSRKRSGTKQTVNLLEVLNQTLRFLGHQIQKQRVRITIEEPREPALIEGFDNQIQQVFVNLIVNAMDAMLDGGDLQVYFKRKHDLLTMSFKDSGIGMDDQTRTSIFDPFFTTKEVGKGTGLGLAVVFNILRDHSARVEVDSALSKGSTFHLIFHRPNNGMQ